MRVDSLRRRDTVFPLLLHFRVHDEQGVMREVDGDLARGIGVFLGLFTFVGGSDVVLGNDATDAEFAGDTEGDGSDDCSRAEVGELVAVIANAFGRAVVAVYKGCVGSPWAGGLVFELFAVGVVGIDAGCDF